MMLNTRHVITGKAKENFSVSMKISPGRRPKEIFFNIGNKIPIRKKTTPRIKNNFCIE
jgi:hypothetical protein